MPEAQRLITLGSVGGTPIQADTTVLGSAVPVRVTLTANYTLANPRPAAFPFRPSFTGADAADLDYPRVIPSGTTLELLACESDALIAASAAVLA